MMHKEKNNEQLLCLQMNVTSYWDSSSACILCQNKSEYNLDPYRIAHMAYKFGHLCYVPSCQICYCIGKCYKYCIHLIWSM